MLNSTTDIIEAMDQLYQDLLKGNVTTSAARARTSVVKLQLDAVKVEIAACALGKTFGAVDMKRRSKVVPIGKARKAS